MADKFSDRCLQIISFFFLLLLLLSELSRLKDKAGTSGKGESPGTSRQHTAGCRPPPASPHGRTPIPALPADEATPPARSPNRKSLSPFPEAGSARRSPPAPLTPQPARPRPSSRRWPSAGAVPGLRSAPRPAPPASLAPPAGSPAAGEPGEANGRVGGAAVRQGLAPVPSDGGGAPRPGPSAASSWARRGRGERPGGRRVLRVLGSCCRPAAGGVGRSAARAGRGGFLPDKRCGASSPNQGGSRLLGLIGSWGF